MAENLLLPRMNIADISFLLALQNEGQREIVEGYLDHSEALSDNIYKIAFFEHEKYFNRPPGYEPTYESPYYYRGDGLVHYLWSQTFFGFIDLLVKRGRFFFSNSKELFAEPFLRFCSAWALFDDAGLMFHSAGLSLAGCGLLFPARPEGGKSTLCSLASGLAEVLCDEMNVVRRRADGWYLWGTPFWGDADSGSRVSQGFPLKAILFPHKDDRFWLKRCDGSSAVIGILANILMFGRSAQVGRKAFELAWDMASNVPAFDFGFVQSKDLVPYLRENLVGKICTESQ